MGMSVCWKVEIWYGRRLWDRFRESSRRSDADAGDPAPRDDDALVSQRNARIGRIGDVGEKYAFPNSGALRVCTSCT